MQIMQGDQYNIPFEISDSQGEAILPAQVESVEFSIGNMRKSYPDEVTYSGGQYLFPITQQEAFSMQNSVPVQIRVKFSNGDIVGASAGGINVAASISKAVL